LLANQFAKKSRGEQFFLLMIDSSSGYLHHAVMAAYEGILRMVHNQVIFYI
jgi:DNA mismatch repair protein MutL